MSNFRKLAQATLLAAIFAIVPFYVSAQSDSIASGDPFSKGVDSISQDFVNESMAKSRREGEINDAKYDTRKSQKAKNNADKANAATSNATAAAEQAKKDAAAAQETANQEKAQIKSQWEDYMKTTGNKVREDLAAAEKKRTEDIKAAQKEREDYIAGVKKAEEAKVQSAQQAYDKCVQNEGKCSELLVALNNAQANQKKAVSAAENDQTYQDKIAAAQKGDANYQNLKEQSAEVDKKVQEYQSSFSAAQQKANAAKFEQSKANQAAQNAAKEEIQANKKLYENASKEADKAQKAFDKAKEDVTKACQKDPESSKCKKAKEKMDEASTQLAAAKREAEDAKNAMKEAQNEIDELDGTADARRKAEADAKAAAEKAAAEKAVAEEISKQYDEAKNKYNELKKACNADPDNCDQNALKEAEAAMNEAYERKAAVDPETAAEKARNDQARAEAAAKQKILDDAAAADKAYEEKNKAFQDAVAAYSKLQAQCAAKEDAEGCDKLAELKDQVDNARKELESAYQDKVLKNRAADEAGVSDKAIAENAKKAVQTAEDKVKAVEEEQKRLEAALKEAEAACAHSKTLTSRQGQADAAKYCQMVEDLKKEIAANKEALAEAEEALIMAQNDYEIFQTPDDEHEGQIYLAVSSAADSGVDESGLFNGRYTGRAGNELYTNTDDVFKTITRRAARILVGLKPIVYTFAGFGLIAFAFAAIFNKISWKWFANIAIGLFLVANMGRLIEYMVYPTNGKDVKPEPLKSFGNYTLEDAFADTYYVWVDEMAPFVPPEVADAPDTSTPVPENAGMDEAPAEERKFCQAENKGGGLFGGGGFMSCVKDLISAGKKAVNAVKDVKSTIDTVKSTADAINKAADNIGAAAKAVGKGLKNGDFANAFDALGDIGQNLNYATQAVGSAANRVTNNVGDFSNNVQDMTKTREKQAELAERRAKGEATNEVEAKLKGQTLTRDENGKITGVEHRWAGDIEYETDEGGNVVKDENGNPKIKVKKSGYDQKGNEVEGDIASNQKNSKNWGSGKSGFGNMVDDITEKSRKANGVVQDATSTASGAAYQVQGVVKSLEGK